MKPLNHFIPRASLLAPTGAVLSARIPSRCSGGSLDQRFFFWRAFLARPGQLIFSRRPRSNRSSANPPQLCRAQIPHSLLHQSKSSAECRGLGGLSALLSPCRTLDVAENQ